MTDVQIREIDPHDEAALRAWWEVGHQASAERPYEAWPAWEVSRVALPTARNDVELTLLVAVENGRHVGTALMTLFLLDNTHLAEATVYVLPAYRRRGIGRTLLAEVEDRTRRARRTTVLASAFAPTDDDSPGSLFAAACGYPVASAEENKVVDLATSAPTWSALDGEVEAALGDYRLAVFDSRIPDEYVDDFCALLSVFLDNIPLGDLDLREAEWTPERVRANEERVHAAGRQQVIAVAIAPDGHLCGFSDLGINRADPGHASVGATLVLPAHRGHRLGLGMKLLSHRRVLELFPSCAFVETGNDGVNAPMNLVNERMGYRVVERCLDVQKVLRPAVVARLRPCAAARSGPSGHGPCAAPTWPASGWEGRSGPGSVR